MARLARAAQTLDERHHAGFTPDAAKAFSEFSAPTQSEPAGRYASACVSVPAGADPIFTLAAFLAGSISLQSLPVSLLSAYAGSLAVAAAALVLEKRLDFRLTGGILLYPVFMACFLPLQTLALFKTQTVWHEIRHSGVRLASSEFQLRRKKIA